MSDARGARGNLRSLSKLKRMLQTHGEGILNHTKYPHKQIGGDKQQEQVTEARLLRFQRCNNLEYFRVFLPEDEAAVLR